MGSNILLLLLMGGGFGGGADWSGGEFGIGIKLVVVNQAVKVAAFF